MKRKESTTNHLAVTTPRLVQRHTCLAGLVASCILALGLSGAAQDTFFITFDPPGSHGTTPTGFTDWGAITGFYADANNALHGFVRMPWGKFITFDVNGAGTMAGQGTFPYSVNWAGVITGYYLDSGNAAHGFVRSPVGRITKIDVPGAVACCGQGTFPANINPEGAIAGSWVDPNFVLHAFVRTPFGRITSFDVDGAGIGFAQGTYTTSISGINAAGEIAGVYVDANDVQHGFLRTRYGSITKFDAPGASPGPGSPGCIANAVCPGTISGAINAEGTIAGFYLDTNNVEHGFVRSPQGEITTFDVPGAGAAGPLQGTVSQNINTKGVIAGFYTDTDYFRHGFLDSSDGDIQTFDVPGVVNSGPFSGTTPVNNNAEGAVTGYYTDADGVSHGFVMETGSPRPGPLVSGDSGEGER